NREKIHIQYSHVKKYDLIPRNQTVYPIKTDNVHSSPGILLSFQVSTCLDRFLLFSTIEHTNKIIIISFLIIIIIITAIYSQNILDVGIFDFSVIFDIKANGKMYQNLTLTSKILFLLGRGLPLAQVKF